MIDLYYEDSSYFPSSLTLEEVYDLVDGVYAGAGQEQCLTESRDAFNEKVDRFTDSKKVMGKRPNRREVKVKTYRGEVRWINVDDYHYMVAKHDRPLPEDPIWGQPFSRPTAIEKPHYTFKEVLDGTYIKLFDKLAEDYNFMNRFQYIRLEAEGSSVFTDKGIVIHRSCGHADIRLSQGAYIRMEAPFEKVAFALMNLNHSTVKTTANGKEYLFAIVSGYTSEKDAVTLTLMPILVKGD